LLNISPSISNAGDPTPFVQPPSISPLIKPVTNFPTVNFPVVRPSFQYPFPLNKPFINFSSGPSFPPSSSTVASSLTTSKDKTISKKPQKKSTQPTKTTKKNTDDDNSVKRESVCTRGSLLPKKESSQNDLKKLEVEKKNIGRKIIKIVDSDESKSSSSDSDEVESEESDEYGGKVKKKIIKERYEKNV
jgi:hypothetical protein